MINRGGLAVYVTSHGFGHHNRTVAVLNEIPDDVPIVIRSAADLEPAWRERLKRPARLEAAVWDTGAVNPPGDSAATDARATIERAAAFWPEALQRVSTEAQRLRAEGTVCVLCDVPPLPLRAAAQAGIPGYLLANFTWAEIYAEHAESSGVAGAAAFVREIGAAYGEATGAFRCRPGLPLRGVPQVTDVGIVAAPASDRRDTLRQLLNISENEKLVYFYVGRYGQSDLAWHRLAEYRGVQFVSFHAPPGVCPENFHVVPTREWTGADLTASCDAVVAKAGYGSAAEAMAARTPLVYPPRRGFAEHPALDEALRGWGGGIPLTDAQFAALDLGDALRRAFDDRPGPPPFPTDGARRIAKALTEVCRGFRTA